MSMLFSLTQKKKNKMNKEYDFTTATGKALFTINKKCSWCGGDSLIKMTYNQNDAFVNKTSYIQDIFPHIEKDLREVLISGTHPECWIEMFEDIEEDDVEEIEAYVGNE